MPKNNKRLDENSNHFRMKLQDKAKINLLDKSKINLLLSKATIDT